MLIAFCFFCDKVDPDWNSQTTINYSCHGHTERARSRLKGGAFTRKLDLGLEEEVRSMEVKQEKIGGNYRLTFEPFQI